MSELEIVLEKGKKNETGCLVWTGTKSNRGHAIYNHKLLGPVTAARFVWECLHGRLRGRKVVMMTCGNRLCINPEHMKTGSYPDSYRNSLANGNTMKRRRGAQVHTAKLTDEKVAKIREAHLAGGVSINALAKSYAVSHRTIDMVVKGRTWTHVGGAV